MSDEPEFHISDEDKEAFTKAWSMLVEAREAAQRIVGQVIEARTDRELITGYMPQPDSKMNEWSKEVVDEVIKALRRQADLHFKQSAAMANQAHALQDVNDIADRIITKLRAQEKP
jgi:hypothetical protein